MRGASTRYKNLPPRVAQWDTSVYRKEPGKVIPQTPRDQTCICVHLKSSPRRTSQGEARRDSSSRCDPPLLPPLPAGTAATRSSEGLSAAMAPLSTLSSPMIVAVLPVPVAKGGAGEARQFVAAAAVFMKVAFFLSGQSGPGLPAALSVSLGGQNPWARASAKTESSASVSAFNTAAQPDVCVLRHATPCRLL